MTFQQRSTQHAAAHAWLPATLASMLLGVAGGHTSLLASLSNSLRGASGKGGKGAQQQQQQQQDSRGGAAAPTAHQFVDKLSALTLDFLECQAVADQVYRLHTAVNGYFPRPCPMCASCEFNVPCTEEVVAAAAAEHKKMQKKKEKQQRGGSRGGRGKSGSGGGGGEVVRVPGVGTTLFQSRPLVCDQCQRWFHLGCVGARYVEDVPSRPWLHCSECARTFVKLEVLGRRGTMLAPPGPGGPMSYSVLTPTDFRAFLTSMAYEAAGVAGQAQAQQQAQQQGGPMGGAGAAGGWAGGGGGGGGGSSRMLAGSRMMPLLELLGSSDATAGALQGFNDSISECDAGRYAVVVQQDGLPVSAATFNVFGEGLPAQVNLVVTAAGSRRQGHCRALFEVLESVMEELKVDTLLVQPHPGLDAAWATKLGYKPMHPADVANLHAVVPLAYLDAPVLEKQL